MQKILVRPLALKQNRSNWFGNIPRVEADSTLFLYHLPRTPKTLSTSDFIYLYRENGTVDKCKIVNIATSSVDSILMYYGNALLLPKNHCYIEARYIKTLSFKTLLSKYDITKPPTRASMFTYLRKL